MIGCLGLPSLSYLVTLVNTTKYQPRGLLGVGLCSLLLLHIFVFERYQQYV